jgi:hypothetical protein
MFGTCTCWFEVTGLSAGNLWTRFDQVEENAPGGEYTGDITSYDVCDPVQFAVDELENALPDIVSVEPVYEDYETGAERRQFWAAVRVRVWPGGPDDLIGQPVALVQATPDQLARARVKAAAREVEDAQRAVEDARSRLRGQIVAADIAGVGRNQIARITDQALARRLVLRHLAAHDLRAQALRLLPKEVGDQVDITIDTGDEVHLSLRPAGLNDVQLEARLTTQEAGDLQQRAVVLAETVTTSLTRGSLLLLNADGSPARTVDLAPGRQPDDPPLTDFGYDGATTFPACVVARHPHSLTEPVWARSQ